MQHPVDPSRWEGEGRPRNDLRMVMSAIRAGWVIDPVIKGAIVGRASRILANPDAKARDVARASSTLLAIERLTLDAAKEEDRMQRLDAGQATERLELMEAISDQQLEAVARSLASRPSRPPALPHVASEALEAPETHLEPADAPAAKPAPTRKPRKPAACKTSKNPSSSSRQTKRTPPPNLPPLT